MSTQSPPKTWTYEEITASVENQIERCMRLSRAEAINDPKSIYRHYATGALLAWQFMCEGSVIEDDEKRLRALIENNNDLSGLRPGEKQC